MKRILHRDDGMCHARDCTAASKKHNKVYWHDGRDVIYSAHYCRDHYYRIVSPQDWIANYYSWNESAPRFNGFTTMKACAADLITRALA